MSIREFSLIERYFQRKNKRDDVELAIGDDAAIIIPHHQRQVIAMDTCNAGIHFLPKWPAHVIGHRALAVNLSDIAAMGATPAFFTLSLSMPEVDENWVQGFARGMFDLAEQYDLTLIGGDTTRGPLAVTIQVQGYCDHQGLRRDRACLGDKIYVSGHLGSAYCGLMHLLDDITLESEQRVVDKLWLVPPRIALGRQLATLAHAAIDISDGLGADLQHILQASNCGADIYIDNLPLAEELQAYAADIRVQKAIAAGDEYELCFTAPPEHHDAIMKLNDVFAFPITCIGDITAGNEIQWLQKNGSQLIINEKGFQHF